MLCELPGSRPYKSVFMVDQLRYAATGEGRCLMDPWPCPTFRYFLSTEDSAQQRHLYRYCLSDVWHLPLIISLLRVISKHVVSVSVLWQCVHARPVSTTMPHLRAEGRVFVLRCRRQPRRTARHPALQRSERWERGLVLSHTRCCSFSFNCSFLGENCQ